MSIASITGDVAGRESDGAVITNKSEVREFPLPPVPPDLTGNSELWFANIKNDFNDEFVDPLFTSASWTENFTASIHAINPVEAFDPGGTGQNIADPDPRKDINEKRSWYRIQPPNVSTAVPYGIHKTFGGGELPNGLYWTRMTTRYLGSSDDTESGMGMWLMSSAGDPAEPDFVTGVPTDARDGISIFTNRLQVSTQRPRFIMMEGGSRTGNFQLQDATTSMSHISYAAIIKSGSTYDGFMGSRGGNWIYIGRHVHGGGVTIDRVFIGLHCTQGVDPGNLIGAADFFRYRPFGDGGVITLP